MFIKSRRRQHKYCRSSQDFTKMLALTESPRESQRVKFFVYAQHKGKLPPISISSFINICSACAERILSYAALTILALTQAKGK
jgi:hypothetical protein